MKDHSVFRIERLELYRTGLEFARVAKRIEQALPARKNTTRAELLEFAGEIPDKLAQGTAEISRRGALESYRLALRSTARCTELVDRLHMVNMGGFSDVTTGLELLERLFAGITQLIDDTGKFAEAAGENDVGSDRSDQDDEFDCV